MFLWALVSGADPEGSTPDPPEVETWPVLVEGAI